MKIMKPERREFLVRMQDGEFLKSIQIDPPKTSSAKELFSDIERLKQAGVSLLDINASRRLSLDSIQLASSLTHFGLQVIPHVTTRDRSLPSILNKVLGAYALSDIRDFLVISGDPYDPSINDSSGIFQRDSLCVLKEIDSHLRNSQLALNLTLGAAVNQNSLHHIEGERVEAKVRVGADFFMSQPIFTPQQAEFTFRFYRQHANKPLIMGVWPLTHLRTIENIRSNKVVGVSIPDEIYEEALGYKDDPSGLRNWGVRQTSELIRFIDESGFAQAIYVVAPLKNPGQLIDLVQSINNW